LDRGYGKGTEVVREGGALVERSVIFLPRCDHGFGNVLAKPYKADIG
jgi:hypothetical protein